MKQNCPPAYYADYLGLDKLLDCQVLRSAQFGQAAHDEMLFIIVHQAYELWFKQILHELDAVREAFQQEYVPEKTIGIAVARLQRITEIQKLLLEQVRVLETMTPLDFLDFRDYLLPASGFQSYQFRLIEIKLGLPLRGDGQGPPKNLSFTRLSDAHQEILLQAMHEPSMFALLEKWLERTPFVRFEGFDFWASYRRAVKKMLAADRETIRQNPNLNADEKAKELAELHRTEQSFAALFDEQAHREMIAQGKRRLSLKATQAALLISLYRDEPILHLPFRLITVLVDIDELFTTWRHRHVLMAHRMIGSKIGTGGTSGIDYLKKAAERNKVFTDLFNLSTFFIPRSALPKLPESFEQNLGFYYSDSD
ncbi:MAG: tryptophan 2,3-dioxygenase family protein [bacterium]